MRSAAPFTQNHLNCQTWRSDAPKCNPSQEICSRTFDHVWRIRRPREMHLCRPSSNVPRLPFFFHRCTKPRRLAHFWQGAESIAPATQNRIRTAKSGPRPSVLALLTPKGASRALFRHLNLQKWSDTDVLLAFWLRNMLRTTTGCTFLNSSATKSVPNLRCFRSWVWSKCASCNNCVHFFQISTPKSAPRLRCFDHFWFQICFAPERRSIFWFFLSDQMSRHPPL